MTETATPTGVLLVDDHTLFRRGIRLIIEQEPDLHVVGEASDGLEALERLRAGDVDLVVMDVSMPRMTGLQAAREIQRRDLPVRVLFVSMHDNEQYLLEALKCGAAGYVLKSALDRDLIDACRAAVHDQPFLYPSAMRLFMEQIRNQDQPRPDSASNVLTPREDEVVTLIAEGRTGREIARILVISPKTVERHRANAMEKLGFHDRVQLTRFAIRTGLIEP